MGLDALPDLQVAAGERRSAEVAVADDVLVKVFALGPGATLEPHEHSDSSNVFHVLDGALTVIQDGTEETVHAPGVVFHDRGVEHGARNDTDEPAVVTATLAPFPG